MSEDRHFANRIQSSSIIKQEPAGQERSLSDKVSKEEIQKVKKEWEQREKEKKEKKEKEKEEKKKEGDEKDKDKKEKEKGWLETITSPFSSQEEVKPSGRGASSTSKLSNEFTNQPTNNTNSGPKEHERYSLHRDFYQMRVEERKKKEALKRAAELKMPQAPKGALGGGI